MKKYNLILADPPWRQSRGGKKAVRPLTSGEELVYPTLSLSDIKGIIRGADNLCEGDHALFLWTIDKYLFEAEKIALDLGFKLHARMIWDKVTGIPAAFTVRYGHEYLLWFYKKKLMPIEKSERGKIHTVFREQVKKHSQKPEISYEIIERLYPSAIRLELFARRARPGWDVWGNEVNCDCDLNY